MDQGNYALYKKKYVTFNDNDELVKLAELNDLNLILNKYHHHDRYK